MYRKPSNFHYDGVLLGNLFVVQKHLSSNGNAKSSECEHFTDVALLINLCKEVGSMLCSYFTVKLLAISPFFGAWHFHFGTSCGMFKMHNLYCTVS